VSGAAGRPAEILSARGGMSSKQEHPIQAMGFWLFGFLSVVLAVLKYGGGVLVVVEGDAAIPRRFWATTRCISL
jgi:hypothetical protein